MNCGPEGAEPINSYALVSYVRGPLKEFLDALRAELVLGCTSQAHVTVLPPRPLIASSQSALQVLSREVPKFSAFEVQVTDIRVFDITHVIYADIGRGQHELAEMHQALNREGLYCDEPFDFHPHLTLAQGLQPEQVKMLQRTATERWRDFKGSRSFEVDRLTFVQNTAANKWLDLATFELEKAAALA